MVPLDFAAAEARCKSMGMSLPASLSLIDVMKDCASDQEPFDPCAFTNSVSSSPMDDPFPGGEWWSDTPNALPVIGKFLGDDPEKIVVVWGRGVPNGASKTEKHLVRCWRGH